MKNQKLYEVTYVSKKGESYSEFYVSTSFKKLLDKILRVGDEIVDVLNISFREIMTAEEFKNGK